MWRREHRRVGSPSWSVLKGAEENYKIFTKAGSRVDNKHLGPFENATEVLITVPPFPVRADPLCNSQCCFRIFG